MLHSGMMLVLNNMEECNKTVPGDEDAEDVLGNSGCPAEKSNDFLPAMKGSHHENTIQR